MIQTGPDSRSWWNARAGRYLGTPNQICAVCDEGHLVGRLRRAVLEERGAHLVAKHLPDNGAVLDVGCGYGRWFSLNSQGRALVGIDMASSMVRAAAANGYGVPVSIGDVRQLPFRQGIFAGVYTMKVLQFLPRADRPAAVGQILAALEPAGTAILFEKICGAGSSGPSEWIRWAVQAGGQLICWYGNQFLPIDRLLTRCLDGAKRIYGRDSARSQPTEGVEAPPLRHKHRRIFGLYRFLREMEMRMSLLPEPVFDHVLPRDWAQHGIFVFRKLPKP